MAAWNFFWCSIPSSDWRSMASDSFRVAGETFDESVRFKSTSQSAEVIDPIYGTTHQYPVYALVHKGLTLKVAYQEHTPGVYLAFADDDTLPFCFPRFRWDREAKWVRVA
jgi:hypothetical protein